MNVLIVEDETAAYENLVDILMEVAPDIQIAEMVSNEQNRLGRPLPINTLLILNYLKDAPRSDIHQISEALNIQETIAIK